MVRCIRERSHMIRMSKSQSDVIDHHAITKLKTENNPYAMNETQEDEIKKKEKKK